MLKTKSIGTKNFFAVAFLLSTVVILAVESTQYAFADETGSPDDTTNISVVAQNTQITYSVTAASSANAFQPPHNGNVFVVEHTEPASGLILTPPAVLGNDCTINDAAISGKYWRLENPDHSLANFHLGSMGDSASITFTDGTTVAAQSTSGGATWSNANLHWHEYTTGNTAGAGTADLTTLGGNWAFQNCGREDNTQGGTKGFADSENFEVVTPVGGSVLPIDTVSLLVSGVFMNSIFALPVALALVGFATLGIVKLSRKK